MASQGLANTPDQVGNLKGDEARAGFINLFKDVQRLKTKLDQYTDLTEEDHASIAAVMPEDQLKAFRGAYLETARQLKQQQDSGAPDENSLVQQLDFEFVLFASAAIRLAARYLTIFCLNANNAPIAADKPTASKPTGAASATVRCKLNMSSGTAMMAPPAPVSASTIPMNEPSKMLIRLGHVT